MNLWQTLRNWRQRFGPSYPFRDWFWGHIIQIVGTVVAVCIGAAAWLKKVGVGVVWEYPDRHFTVPRILLYAALLMIIGYVARLKVNGRHAPKKIETLRRTLSDSDKVVNYLSETVVHLGNLHNEVLTEDRSQRLMVRLLEGCRLVFASQRIRAHILMPDETEQWLHPYSHSQMPRWSSGRQRRFFIGNQPHNESGVAGLAYHDSEPIVVHIKQVEGKWEADHPAFVHFNDVNREPLYKSFVSIRMVRSGDNESAVGVLCIDSQLVGTFDNEETLKLAQVIARAVAVPLERAAKAKQLSEAPVNAGPNQPQIATTKNVKTVRSTR